MMKSMEHIIIAVLSSFASANKFSLPLFKELDNNYAANHRLVLDTIKDLKQKSLHPSYDVDLINHLQSPGGAPIGDVQDYWAIYTVDIGLGTPSQQFRAIIDLAWSDTFVPSSSCEGQHCKAFPRSYNSQLSSTYVENGTAGTLLYSPIEGFGFVSSDHFTLGSTAIPNLNFFEMFAYNLPSTPPPELQMFDSVLGLAIDAERPPTFRVPQRSKIASPFRQMIEKGILQRNMFSVLWPSDSTITGDLMFGGTNNSLFQGKLTSHRLYPENTTEWRIRVRSVYMDVKDGRQLISKQDATSERNMSAIFSSRTPFISIPGSLAHSLFKKINWEISECTGSIVVDCERLSDLPDLIIEFEKQNITMHGQDYIVRRKPIDSICEDTSDECIVMVGSSPTNGDDAGLMTLGLGFLKKFYTVFDWDEKSVSFGRLQGD